MFNSKKILDIPQRNPLIGIYFSFLFEQMRKELKNFINMQKPDLELEAYQRIIEQLLTAAVRDKWDSSSKM